MLWIAFVVVHLGVAVLGWLLPNQPMGDVYNVYQPWSAAAIAGSDIVGITSSWVYPQLALVPMVLAQGLAWVADGVAGYLIAWAILVTLVDAAGFAVLIGRARSTGRTVAAWFWLAYLAMLGPIAMYRIDAITVPLAIAGCLWLVGRPWIGSALLAVATWIKVWPAALLAAAVIALRRRFAVLGGALAVSAGVAVFVAAAGGAAHLFGFIADQADRGLQIEAPVSTFYLWGAALQVPNWWVTYNPDLLTFEVYGPGLDGVIAAMTPLLAIGMLAIAAVGAVKTWRGASFLALFPALSLSLVLAFIVLNKVGSPQYLVWPIVPIVIGLAIDRHRWWGPAVLSLVVAGLTQAVYPVFYDRLMTTFPVPWVVLLLTVRNVGTITLFVWAIVRLAGVAPHPRHRLSSWRDAAAFAD